MLCQLLWRSALALSHSSTALALSCRTLSGDQLLWFSPVLVLDYSGNLWCSDARTLGFLSWLRRLAKSFRPHTLMLCGTRPVAALGVWLAGRCPVMGRSGAQLPRRSVLSNEYLLKRSFVFCSLATWELGTSSALLLVRLASPLDLSGPSLKRLSVSIMPGYYDAPPGHCAVFR